MEAAWAYDLIIVDGLCEILTCLVSCVVYWTMLQALLSLKSMAINHNNSCFNVNTVIPRSLLSISTWQNSLFSSGVEKTYVSPGESMNSSIFDIEYDSRFVDALNLLYSTQKRRVLSVLGARAIGAVHSVLLVLQLFRQASF